MFYFSFLGSETKPHCAIQQKQRPVFGSTTFRPSLSHPIQLLCHPHFNFDRPRKHELCQHQNDSFKTDNEQMKENDEEKTIILDLKDYKVHMCSL